MANAAHGRQLALGKRLASYRSFYPSPIYLASYLTLILILASLASMYIGPLAWCVVGVTLLVGGAWLYRLNPLRRSLELYQHGIEYRIGRRRRYVLWHQVYEVYQTPLFGSLLREKQVAPRGWMYRLVQRDGRSIRLHNFESIRGLGMRIQQQVAQRQLPIAMDAYRAGYCVRFGRLLSISSEGIQLGSQRIAWSEIAEISIDEADELQVTRVGEAKAIARVACSRIPNLAVLDGILQTTQAETELTEQPDDPLADWPEDESKRATAVIDEDFTSLLLDGYDWEDISDLNAGHVTINELLQRGPRRRRRRPR